MIPHFHYKNLIQPLTPFTEEPQDEAFKQYKKHPSHRSLPTPMGEFCLLFLTFLISCFYPPEETWKVGLSLPAFLASKTLRHGDGV